LLRELKFSLREFQSRVPSFERVPILNFWWWLWRFEGGVSTLAKSQFFRFDFLELYFCFIVCCLMSSLFCFMLNFVFDVGYQNSEFCGFQFGLGFNRIFWISIRFLGLGFFSSKFTTVEFEFMVFSLRVFHECIGILLQIHERICSNFWHRVGNTRVGISSICIHFKFSFKFLFIEMHFVLKMYFGTYKIGHMNLNPV